MVGRVNSLLDNSVVSFSFWNMVLWIRKVHSDSEFVVHCILERLKLIITSDFHDAESGFVVHLKDISDGFGVIDHRLLVYELGRSIE